jgi:quercetin dioxygenase-like cupin family protein
MAPPLTGGGLIPRAETIGAVNRETPEGGYGPREESRLTNQRGTMMGKFVAAALLCLATSTAMAQEAKVTSLMSKALADNPGKEVLMITVEYPPGSVDPSHRHNAQAFVYVLEGSIVMQVRGGKEVTLTPGQTFYEGPDDVHVVGRNASATEPAKFLVVLIKNKGAPVLVPAE